jgi:hypothetical protein
MFHPRHDTAREAGADLGLTRGSLVLVVAFVEGNNGEKVTVKILERPLTHVAISSAMDSLSTDFDIYPDDFQEHFCPSEETGRARTDRTA